METSLLESLAPELEPASNWFQYGLVRFYAAAGGVLAEKDFDLPVVANQSAWWTGSLALPAGCVRYSLFGHRGGNDQLKTTWAKAGNLRVQIDRNLLPGTIGDTLTVAWEIQADDLQAASHLASQVYLSTNHGVTWEHLGKATDQTYWILPTDGLPRTDALAIRVVASDGFTSVQDTVTGLVIGDRPPVLEVAAPRNGDVALAGTVWPLRARAFDLEDGDLVVTWQSSRDGLLGSSAVLSIGWHRLTCSATDSAGHRVERSLEVTVTPTATSTDLSIASVTLLGLNHELRENWNLAAGGLRSGETNVLDCVIRNSGILTTGLVTLQIEQPDGTVASLPSVTAEFTPLTFHRINLPFVPEQYGVYTLTVSVHAADLPDRTSADNVVSLRSFTYAPSLLALSSGTRQEFVFLSTRYDFPEPAPGEPIIPIPVTETLDLYNGGYVPLVISNAFLTCGPDFCGADHFRIFPPVSFPVTLPPASSLYMELQFYGTTLAPETTSLRVLSNDPRHPDCEIPVHGWVHPAADESWRDQDSDGLPSFLETRIGLNPSLADSDGDGVVDGQEDRNADGIRDPFETGALDPDSDDDGLLDGEEDLNGNGGHDGPETSPLLADSDGDGVSDAEEARCRTSGLQAADFLRLWGPVTAGAELRLEWEGRAGVPYRIEISQDLNRWLPAPSGTDPDQQAEVEPKVNGPLRYRGAVSPGSAFYRLGVTAP